MSFSSLSFLFLFIVIVCAVYWIIPERYQTAKMIVLFGASILFYAWGDVQALPLLLLSVLFNYFSGEEIRLTLAEGRTEGIVARRNAQIMVMTAVAVDVAVLVIFKYSSLTMPLGISFYTFSALSYVFDVYYGRAADDGNIFSVFFYITFFPKLVSGPIVEFKDMIEQIKVRTLAKSDFAVGISQFITGLFKKVLLADNLRPLVTEISSNQTMAAGTAWLGMIYYSLELYFDFSGYSDMAIGLARLFGFQFDKNFDYPYLSVGMADFWRRWHISLGHWFRDYVYIPLGGNRCSRDRQIFNLAVVWILTGLWHGNTLNFLFWGLWHGALVILERFVLKADHWPKVIRIILTDLAAGIGWVFFFNPDLSSSFHYFGQMLGRGHLGFVDTETIYYFTGNLLLLIVCVIGCGPAFKKLSAVVTGSGLKGRVVSYIVMGLLLAVTIAYMIGSTYTSFLYFAF